MKLDVTVDLEDLEDIEDFYEELRSVVFKNITNVIAEDILYNWDFTKVREDIKKQMSGIILQDLIKSVESKKEFYERVFKVKDFADLTKSNEAYLIELIDKAIVKKFK